MAFDVEASGKGGGTGRNRPEMNVTPLVDVVLVLLIIFMVVMPMLTEQFWVHVPKRPQEDETPARPADDSEPPIVVSVNREGRIRINQQVFEDQELAPRLRRMLVARGERKVYFDAADEVPFERAVEAMDLARGGGAAHIAVLTEALR